LARTPFVTRKNPARRAYFTTLDRQQQAAFPTKALEWRDPTLSFRENLADLAAGSPPLTGPL